MDGRSRVATRRIGTAFSGDSSPAVKYLLEDHLGNSSVTVDGSNSSLISREEYFPFGETSFGSYARKRYRFCGKERDEESGLYYYGARYYAPWSCRFVSIDPLAGDYPFYTPYQYAGNRPINFVDLDGLEPGVQQPESSSAEPTQVESGGSAAGAPHKPQPTSKSKKVTATVSGTPSSTPATKSTSLVDFFGDNVPQIGGGTSVSDRPAVVDLEKVEKAAKISMVKDQLTQNNMKIMTTIDAKKSEQLWQKQTELRQTLDSLQPSPELKPDAIGQGYPSQLELLQAERKRLVSIGVVGDRIGFLNHEIQVQQAIENGQDPSSILPYKPAWQAAVDAFGPILLMGAKLSFGGGGNRVTYQYSLRAVQSGYYPVMKAGYSKPQGSIFLNKGEPWKYGTTVNLPGRYSQKELLNKGAGLKIVPEFEGTNSQAIFVQKMKIANHIFQYGVRPPGNKNTN